MSDSEILEPASGSDTAVTPGEGRKPAPGGSGTASADELNVSLSQVSPDPYLGEFRPEVAPGRESSTVGPAAPVGVGRGPLESLDLDVPPSASWPVAADSPSVGAPASLEIPAPEAAPPSSRPGSVSGQFAALDLRTPPASKGKALKGRRRAVTPDDEQDDEDDDELPARAPNWPMVLLASYASAVSIAWAWEKWSHRGVREGNGGEGDTATVEAAADPGTRASQSRRYVPPPPLAPDRVVALGQTLVLDALEVTPLGVAAGPVRLKRELNPFEARLGGKDALLLKLRLRNRTNETILVPLDEAFLRTRDRGIRDSFIEVGPKQIIEMYPLALASEWSVVGQDFRELGPGEAYETLIASAPGALGRVGREMTWRLRLRTDVSQSQAVGIRFRDQDIERPPTRDFTDRPEPVDRFDG
jgi:hypothetical protein